MTSTYYRSFVKDNAIVIIGHVLVYMKGIILMPVIIKTVGITVYGGFTLLTSMLGIAFGISSFGAGFRARRFLPATPNMETRQQLYYPQFYFQLLSILLLSALLVILDNQVRTHIFKNEIAYAEWIIPAYLVSYFLYSQGSDYFRYTSRVHYMTVSTLSFPYLHIGIILLFYWFYGFISVNVLMASQVVCAVLIGIPCFWLIFSEIGLRGKLYRKAELVSDIKLGFPLVLGFIVDFILAGSDRYFIAFYVSVTDVGYYVPGYVLGSLIVFIPKAMGTVLPQLLSKAVDNNNEYEAQRMLNYAIKIFLQLAIPFIFGSLALGKPILTLLANREVAENAFWVTPIVAAGTLFYGLNILLSNVLFVRMKTAGVFKMNLFAAVFNLIANGILLFIFKSILVSAISTLASYFLAFLYIKRIAKLESWPLDFQYSIVVKSFAASVIMVVSVAIFFHNRGTCHLLLFLVLGLVFAIAVYFLGLLAMRSFSRQEIQFVKGLIIK